MQMSGTFPQLSDGLKKSVTTKPPKVAVVTVKAVRAAAPKVNTHRAGGFHRQRRAK